MKRIVEIGGSRYYIQSEDDLIFLVHKLAKEGYDISSIAKILHVKESVVRKYLQDCW